MFTRRGNAGRVAVLWRCTWGRDQEGAMVPAPLSTGLQSFTPLPTIKLGPSGAGSRVGGLEHTLGPCGSLQRPLLWGWESLLLPPQPPRVFSIRFEALFPCTGALGCVVCFAPCCLSRFICARVWGPRALPAALPAPFSTTLSPALWVYFCANVGLQGLLVVRLAAPFIPHSTSLVPPQQLESSPSQCPSPPLLPVWRNVCFLGVGLPCCSIFCQFWLCEEAQCVYLRCHLGSEILCFF